MSVRRLVLWVVLILTLAFVITNVACGRRLAPGSQATPDSTVVVEPELGDVARLRALGYLEYEEELPRPGFEGVSILDPERAQPGFTLVVYAGSCACDLINLEGETINSWSMSPCRRWYAAVLLDDGDLVVVGSDSDPKAPVEERIAGHFIMRQTWRGEEVWRSRIAAHHSIEVTPDGLLLTVLMERRRIAAISDTRDVIDDVLALVSMDGEVVDRISLYDVLEGSSLDLPIVIAGSSIEGEVCCIDAFHSNSVKSVDVPHLLNTHPMYEGGNVVVTSRNQNTVMVINWARQELVWAWGPDHLSGPHDAAILDDGSVLVFDNGLGRQRSRVLRLNPMSGVLQQYGPPPQVEFFSRVMGACQQLENGNLLITYSAGSQGFELTMDGSLAWAFAGTHRVASGHRAKIARMTRLPSVPIEAIAARFGDDLRPR